MQSRIGQVLGKFALAETPTQLPRLFRLSVEFGAKPIPRSNCTPSRYLRAQVS